MQRRLALSYAAIVSVTLLLLGPALYLSFSNQMASAFDKTLRLAAQRQAALALLPTGFRVGLSNKPFNTSPSLEQRGTFYLVLSPTGRLHDNPGRPSTATGAPCAASPAACTAGASTRPCASASMDAALLITLRWS